MLKTHHRQSLSPAGCCIHVLRLSLGFLIAAGFHSASSTSADAGAPQATWSTELKFEDAMDIYDFPEQRISYRLTFPDRRVKADRLRLFDEAGREAPLQLTEARTAGDFLRQATVHFRADLPRKTVRRFTLTYDPAQDPRSAPEGPTVHPNDDGTADLVGSHQSVRVPRGTHRFDDPRPAADVPAPIVALRGRSGNWIGRGAFLTADADAPKVLGYTAAIEQRGPLFMTYRVTYRFAGDRSYEVRLTIEQGDDHVTVDESLDGFGSGAGVHFRFSFEGLNPDARLVMSNVGYNGDGRGPKSGPYAAGLEGEDGDRLPYELSLFSPNSLSVSRATAFWRDNGEDALLLSINRPEDWKTSQRYVWHSRNKPENLRFHAKENQRYMETQLAGRQRHWAIAAIPRDEVIIAKQGESDAWVAQRDLEQNVPGGTPVRIGAGPEVRLYQRLTDFNLDDYKDMVIDFDEPLEPWGGTASIFLRGRVTMPEDVLELLNREPTVISPEEFWSGRGMASLEDTLEKLVRYYWDWSGGLTHRFGAFSLDVWTGYANSRAHWSEAERRRARAALVFTAELADADNFMPHHSMMGGHPNFISDAKFDLVMASAVFPRHPKAEHWKQSYLDYLDEWLDVFIREPDPTVNARGGRHLENIACYWIVSLRNTALAAKALLKYDGTVIFDDPRLQKALAWTLDGFSPFQEAGRRRVVPIGAHASGQQEIQKMVRVLPILEKTHPDLAAQLEWALTDGRRGKHVPRESALYRDYGAVLWYDHGGENEAMLTVQQLNGSGYRWTGASNGTLYYATDGHNWSWNKKEANGDAFDIEKLPLFNLNGRSLGAHPVDELLHNFHEAQFYRANGSHEVYKWRGVMMRRNDYLAVYDRVADDQAKGEFQWINEASRYDQPLPMPQITAIKDGPGDQLHIVSPEPVRTRTTDYGVIVNDRDHVLFTAEAVSIDRDGLRFKGRTGLASDDAVYLFEGEHLFYNDLGVSREGGDFGVGVWYDGKGAVDGRIVGRRGGRLAVRLPRTPRGGSVNVEVAGEPVASEVEGRTVWFAFEITGADGYKALRITWE